MPKISFQKPQIKQISTVGPQFLNALYQPPYEKSYTLASNKKCGMTVQTVALRFQFDSIDCVYGTYEYRKNAIPGEELAKSYVEYVMESEKVLAGKVSELVRVESTKITITDDAVDTQIQNIIDWLHKQENPRYCTVCRCRSKAWTQECECGSRNLVTVEPDKCPFPLSNSKAYSSSRKYDDYTSIVDKLTIPTAKVFIDSVHDLNPNTYSAFNVDLYQCAQTA